MSIFNRFIHEKKIQFTEFYFIMVRVLPFVLDFFRIFASHIKEDSDVRVSMGSVQCISMLVQAKKSNSLQLFIQFTDIITDKITNCSRIFRLLVFRKQKRI